MKTTLFRVGTCRILTMPLRGSEEGTEETFCFLMKATRVPAALIE